MYRKIKIEDLDGQSVYTAISPEIGSRDPAKLNARSYPDWVGLHYKQCARCPYRGQAIRWCPAAVGIVDLLDTFLARKNSAERVTLEIEHGGFFHRLGCDVQTALGYLLLHRMTYSGCPRLKLGRVFANYFPLNISMESLLFQQLFTRLIIEDLSRWSGFDLDDFKLLSSDLCDVFEQHTLRLGGCETFLSDAFPNAMVTIHSLFFLSDELPDIFYKDLLGELNQLVDRGMGTLFQSDQVVSSVP